MHFSLALLATSALVSAANVDQSTWLKPGPDDVRGPCPGFNTMANYGLLPRDGKNINRDLVVKVFEDFYNMEPKTTNILLDQALKGKLFNADNKTFNLNRLGEHGPIEHDVSLVREDWDRQSAPDSLRHQMVQQTYVDQIKTHGKDNVLTIQGLANFRKDRYEQSKQTNTALEFGLKNPKPSMVAFLEASLVVNLFKTNDNKDMDLNGVTTFLGQEKLIDGFQPPKTPLSLLGSLPLAIEIASRSKIADVEQKIKDAFSGVVQALAQ